MSEPIADRRRPAAPLPARWTPGAVAAGMAALLALAGCAPLIKADCDQLLSERRFQQVLADCDRPYDRASAYMALAGFDLFALYNQITADGNTLTPAGLVSAMGLTPATITVKRRYMEQAVLAVAGAQDNKQAFALLMASGIGMMMSSLEFLDNGSGGGTALDGTFTQAEGEAAMGITKTGATSGSISAFPATLSSGPLAGFPYLSGVVGATRYVFACADIGVSMPWCDNILAGSPQVHDDTGAYGTGAGFQGALQGVVDLTPANPVSLVFQITDLTLPFTLDPAKVPAYQAFSGRGNAAQGFAVGIEGYLGQMQTALVALAQVGSSSQNVLSDAVDSAKGTLDNGARCLPTLFGAPGPPDPALPDAMDAVFPIYQAAIGTSARPMPAGTPASNFFQAYNRIAGLDLTSLGITTPFAVTASSFVFGQGAGTVTTIGTRFLYAKSAVGAFDPAVATPRIDETPAAFQASFEAMRLAPAGSTARDGNISYAELLCIGAGAPPTGVTATAAPGQVTLTWNAALNATGYTVYRSTQPGVTQTSAGATAFPIAVPLPAAPAPPFTDPSAAAGTTYYYVVTSTNASGEGGISREVSATP